MKKASALVAGLAYLCGATAAQTACNVPIVTISHTGSTSPNANAKQLIFVDNTQYPLAKCNDGSPAAFVLRRGLNTASNRWIIDLQAGSSCYTQAGCLLRWQTDTSNGTEPAQLTGTEYWGTAAAPNKKALADIMEDDAGILSPSSDTNPDFWDATVVRVLYCSSDNFYGGGAAQGAFSPSNPATWNFQGRAIIAAVVHTLINQYGLNSASEVMLSGTSSGGVGTYFNINDTAAILPSGSRFVAMGDSGFYDSTVPAYNKKSKIAPYLGPDPTSEQVMLQDSFNMWQGYGDKNCATQAQSPAQAELSCRDVSYLLNQGYIQVPTYIIQSVYDSWQLPVAEGIATCVLYNNCAPVTSQTIAQSTYDAYFADDMMNLIVTSQKSSTTAATVLQFPTHIITTNASFTSPITLQSSNQNSTVAAIFGLWYRNPCSITDDGIVESQFGYQ